MDTMTEQNGRNHAAQRSANRAFNLSRPEQGSLRVALKGGSVMVFRSRHACGLILLTLLYSLVCSSGGQGGGPVEPVPPVAQTGSIRVTTTTTGVEGSLDDGFTLIVDALEPISLVRNATMNFLDLSVGSHMVRLDGVAENCVIKGDNPRSATVLSGETVQVDFTITCAAATGTLVIQTLREGSSHFEDPFFGPTTAPRILPHLPFRQTRKSRCGIETGPENRDGGCFRAYRRVSPARG